MIAVDTDTITTGENIMWGGTFDGTGIALWRNGIQKATDTGGGYDQAANKFCIGHVNTDATSWADTAGWIGTVEAVWVWHRDFSADGMAAFHADPYAMFRPAWYPAIGMVPPFTDASGSEGPMEAQVGLLIESELWS